MINLSIHSHIKEIIIQHELSDKDRDYLHTQLNCLDKDLSFKLNFIEIKYIPSLIVKDLLTLKHKIKIITTQRTLWRYLHKFGIKNTYKNYLDDIKLPNKPLVSTKLAFKNTLKAIGIGGSAGSINHLIPLVKSLPYCDISVFLTIHILPDKPSHLVEILQSKTNYKVCEAEHHRKIEKNCIYIAPPNHHLLTVDGFIFLSDKTKVSYARPAIDVMFKSLAHQYNDSLLAILLCGYGHDGANAIDVLNAHKSEVIVQDPAECKARDLPLNAIKTKNYDYILKVDKIKRYIMLSLYTHLTIEDEIAFFLEKIYVVYDFDFRHYEKRSIIRRVELFMSNNNFTNFKRFEKTILNDISLFERLLIILSINVTSFFRNPEIYKTVKESIIPYLKILPYIRIWSAGCSRGDEPYSLAIMLDEIGVLEKTQIYATDFNETILSEAENGLYPIELFEEFKSNYIDSGGKLPFENYFEIHETCFEVKRRLKDKVLFFQHNLVQDGSINEFHLIFCRNVLIYFDQDLIQRVFKTFDESLCENGFLVLGESEKHDAKYHYKMIGKRSHKIVKKVVTKS